jgi:hypothetical protein
MAAAAALASFRSDGLAADKAEARSVCVRLVAKATSWRFARSITERADAPAARRSTR